MLNCSSLCSSPSLSIWVPAKISLLSTDGSHQHRGGNGRRMPFWWRGFPEKKGRDQNTWLPLMIWTGILSSNKANPAGFCTCCSTVLHLVSDLMYHDSIFVSWGTRLFCSRTMIIICFFNCSTANILYFARFGMKLLPNLLRLGLLHAFGTMALPIFWDFWDRTYL